MLSIRFNFFAVGLVFTSLSFAAPFSSDGSIGSDENIEVLSGAGSVSLDDALDVSGFINRVSPYNDKVALGGSESLGNLIKELGSKFGGTWIEYDSNNVAHQVVGLTSMMVRSASLDGNPNIVRVYVKYSYTQLNDALDRINEKYVLRPNAALRATTTSLDVMNNRVEVGTEIDQVETMTNALIADGFDMDMIRVTYIKRPVAAAVIFNGQGVIFNSAIQRSNCTAGFATIVDDLYQSIITAGHCQDHDSLATTVYMNNGDNNNVSNGQFVGNVWLDQYLKGGPDDAPGLMDAVSFSNWNHAHTLVGRIKSNNFPIVSVITALPGVQVCAEGLPSKWRCGFLLSPASVQAVVSGNRPVRYANLQKTSLCGVQGDSGGPVVAVNFGSTSAAGLYSLGNSSCGSVIGGGSPRVSYIQPIEPYLQKYPNMRIKFE